MNSVPHSGDGAPPVRRWPDPDTFIWVEHPSTNEDWYELMREHVAADPKSLEGVGSVDPLAKRPLERILKQAREAGCRTVLIENRYVDADYRSEYSRYWSRTFKGRPAFARRLHFFTTVIEEHELHRLPPPGEAGYLGYSVLRPTPFGPVGRTVIVPPKDLQKGTCLKLVKDEVHIAGHPFTVEGAPFAQQDGQFLRCAHVAAWMCHYTAVRRGFAARQLTASFAEAAPPALSFDRLLPSHGMNPFELQATFAAFNVPAVVYDIDNLPSVGGVTDPEEQFEKDKTTLKAGGYWDTRIFSIICRYLNSGLPVLVGTDTEHAFTLVGWYRSGDKVHFIANDDVDGPYQVIESPFTDEDRVPWKVLMVPLPPNAFISAEIAENTAYDTLVRFESLGIKALAERFGEEAAEQLVTLGERVKSDKKLSLRTALYENADYKARIADRGLGDAVVRLVRLAQLPHYVWVVEVHDPLACRVGEPCVVAEIVVDCTSESAGPRSDLLLLPGAAWTIPPEPGATPDGTEDVPTCWQTLLPICGTFTCSERPGAKD